METLTNRSFRAFFWNATGQISVQLISFIIGIVLARILDPKEYGLIAISLMFNGISTAFIEGGFSSALIRKKNHNNTDLSTVFIFNLGMALIFYLFFWLLAPVIASFFNQPEIKIIIRILSISMIVSSLGIVQTTLLIKTLNYKTQSLFRIISVIISGVFGVILAIKGYGVWALVNQILLQNLIWTALLWFKSNWIPSLLFSFQSFREMFSFGFKLMISYLLYQIFSQSYNFVFGKFFTISQLSYYNRAEGYQRMSSLTITTMINSVVYPSLSEIQDDDIRLKQGIRRIINMTIFIVAPIMTGLLLLAHPLIVVLITDKWLPVVPILQWLCIAGLFSPLQSVIMNILTVKGRSDKYLYLVIIKECIVIISIIIGYQWGATGVVVSQVAASIIAFLFIGYFAGKLIKLTLLEQIIDIIPFFILSLFMYFVGYFAGYYIENLLVKIIIQFVVCVAFYVSIAMALKLRTMSELVALIRSFLKKN